MVTFKNRNWIHSTQINRNAARRRAVYCTSDKWVNYIIIKRNSYCKYSVRYLCILYSIRQALCTSDNLLGGIRRCDCCTMYYFVHGNVADWPLCMPVNQLHWSRYSALDRTNVGPSNCLLANTQYTAFLKSKLYGYY